MNAVAEDLNAETAIRELVESWTRAARAGDVTAIVSHYAPDIVAFDAVSQLQFRGVEAYQKHWEACLAMCPGPMIFEIQDLEVAANGELAFANGLARCGGGSETGEEKTSWFRLTGAYRKVDGAWRVVHEHFSVPFDMESGKVLFELSP